MRSEQFLCLKDVVILTGLENKRRQMAQLTAIRIPFAVNGCGESLVPIAYIEGRKGEAKQEIATAEKRMALALRGW
jgi:hypothetical protein